MKDLVLELNHIPQTELIIQVWMNAGLVMKIDRVAQVYTAEDHLCCKMFGQGEEGKLIAFYNKFSNVYSPIDLNVHELLAANGAHKSSSFQ